MLVAVDRDSNPQSTHSTIGLPNSCWSLSSHMICEVGGERVEEVSESLAHTLLTGHSAAMSACFPYLTFIIWILEISCLHIRPQCLDNSMTRHLE